MTITTHNSLCSTRAYHLRIDLAHDATVGNSCIENKKILRTRNDLSMEMHSNEGRVCLGILVDVVGPPSAEFCRTVANFPQVDDLRFINPWEA